DTGRSDGPPSGDVTLAVDGRAEVVEARREDDLWIGTATPRLISALAGGMPEEEPVKASTATAERASLSEAGASVELRVRSGEAQFVRVARGHMNRIVTPFPEFDLWTESDEEIQTSGPVFYVSPASDRPISLFITPTGREDLAISLTLVPSAVPPTMITLKLENAAGALVHPAALGSATASPATSRRSSTAAGARGSRP
ncbi:MAG: type-F conjugative transfer system secretin TraK, partial [Pseudomonadota bacterium]